MCLWRAELFAIPRLAPISPDDVLSATHNAESPLMSSRRLRYELFLRRVCETIRNYQEMQKMFIGS